MRTPGRTTAESETGAAAGKQVDEVAADISAALADAADARVDHVVEIYDLDDGWVVHLQATGDGRTDDDRRSEWLVLLDAQGDVVDLDRVTSEV